MAGSTCPAGSFNSRLGSLSSILAPENSQGRDSLMQTSSSKTPDPFDLVSACPAALRHGRRRADITTFGRAALPPVSCGESFVRCNTEASLKGMAGSGRELHLTSSLWRPARVPDFPGECKSMRDRLLFPSPCTQGEGWVGVDRCGVRRGFDLAEPLAKNPHLRPPPEYMGRRKRRLPGSSGTLGRRPASVAGGTYGNGRRPYNGGAQQWRHER